jgi:hypothetical protein
VFCLAQVFVQIDDADSKTRALFFDDIFGYKLKSPNKAIKGAFSMKRSGLSA